MRTITTVFAIAAAAACTQADVITLNPVADAFVSSAQPTGNFGGAGALSIAAPGLPRGEFQTVLRYDTASAVAAFNASYGVGSWVITDIALGFTSTSPNNPIFNAAAPGAFSIHWMQNDSWVEGTGGPSAPSAIGITFATLPSFLSPADEFLGSYNYGGATSGTVLCQPAATPLFAADVSAGNLVSFRLSASDPTAWVFNSRSFGTVSSRPTLSITAIPAPGAAACLIIAALGPLLRRRART